MALNTPVAQAATDVSQVGFKAHWMIPPGGDNPTGLRLDVSTDVNFAAGTFVPNFENRLVGAGVVAMDIPGLAAGTTYHYRLRSEGAGGATSTGSNVISVTTTAAAPPPPPPPQSPVVGIGNVLLVSGGMTFVGPPNTIPLVMLQPQPAQPTPTPTVSQPQHRPPWAAQKDQGADHGEGP